MGVEQHCVETQCSPCASSPYFITEALYIWRFRILGGTETDTAHSRVDTTLHHCGTQLLLLPFLQAALRGSEAALLEEDTGTGAEHLQSSETTKSRLEGLHRTPCAHQLAQCGCLCVHRARQSTGSLGR